MVYNCCICGALRGRDPQRSFHSFPKNQLQREQWYAALGRKIPYSTIICSDHFEENAFSNITVGPKRRLARGAIPTKRLKVEKSDGGKKEGDTSAGDCTTNQEKESGVGIQNSKSDIREESDQVFTIERCFKEEQAYEECMKDVFECANICGIKRVEKSNSGKEEINIGNSAANQEKESTNAMQNYKYGEDHNYSFTTQRNFKQEQDYEECMQDILECADICGIIRVEKSDSGNKVEGIEAADCNAKQETECNKCDVDEDIDGPFATERTLQQDQVYEECAEDILECADICGIKRKDNSFEWTSEQKKFCIRVKGQITRLRRDDFRTNEGWSTFLLIVSSMRNEKKDLQTKIHRLEKKIDLLQTMVNTLKNKTTGG